MKILLLTFAASALFAAAPEKQKETDYATPQERRCYCLQSTGNTWPYPYFLARMTPPAAYCEGVELSSATLHGPNTPQSGLLTCDALKACMKKMDLIAANRQAFMDRMKAAEEKLAACCPLGACDEECATPARREQADIKLDLAQFEGGVKRQPDCFVGNRPEAAKPAKRAKKKRQ
jgi:hypothetical protein